MNIFGENLQFYRKKKALTQEQLAEQLNVSRQTISKWEAGTSYPEMEKILQLCDLFSCTMDTLLRQEAAELEIADSQGYGRHMEKRRRGITRGVVLLVLGLASYELLAGFNIMEAVLNTLFFCFVIVAVLQLAVTGMQHDIFKKQHPVVGEFYTKEERQHFEEKFPSRIATGIGMLLIGFLIGMNGSGLPLRAGMKEDFYYGIFMLLVAIGVGIIVYTALGKEKYDIAAYNQGNMPDSEKKKIDEKVGTWSGCIMILATIVFLVAGLAFGLWHISWLAFPVGGMLCGMASLILHGGK